jgi:hypothetical protein
MKYDILSEYLFKSQPVDALTPVAPELLERFQTYLETHGATIERTRETITYLGQKPGELPEEMTCGVYKVHFPEGTQRHNGYRIILTQPFKITFPDGTALFGKDQVGTTIEEHDQTIFYLPKEA